MKNKFSSNTFDKLIKKATTSFKESDSVYKEDLLNVVKYVEPHVEEGFNASIKIAIQNIEKLSLTDFNSKYNLELIQSIYSDFEILRPITPLS